MIRISDQYFWNFIFTLLFIALVVCGAVILESEAYRPLDDITLLEAVLLGLATMRLTRLFIYDKVTAFIREQFYDIVELKTKRRLEKPKRGPRRTLADLFSCPWCFGVWTAALVVFFYFLTPYALYPVLLLAIAGAGSFLQILANLAGWRAEYAKRMAGE